MINLYRLSDSLPATARLITLILSCCLPAALSAQTHFGYDNNGYWDGYTALMPNQTISTFDPIPGLCGFTASQFQLSEANRSSTGATNGFNSSKYNTASLSEATEAGNYIWFDISALSDTVHLDSVVLLLRKSSTGPTSTNLSYAAGTSPSASYTSLETVTGIAAGSAVEFALISDEPLTINPGETYRFRLTSWGASNVSGTIRIKNGSYVSGYTTSDAAAEVVRFPDIETTNDTIELCLGESYHFSMSGGSAGDTVFYRVISSSTGTSQHHAVIGADSEIALVHEAASAGSTHYIIDSSKTTNPCLPVSAFSDSILFINNSVMITHIDTAVSLCQGDSLYWHDHIIYESGTYPMHYISTKGCDSTVNLVVSFETIYPAYTEGFDFVPRIFTNPLELSFEPIAPYHVSSYIWDFGDGHSSSDPAPVHLYPAFGEYTVVLTVTNECGSSSAELDIHVRPSNTSVDALVSSGIISIFPNPSVDEITIDMLSPHQLTLDQVSIIDISGKEIYTTMPDHRNTRITIDCRHYSPGTYFIRMRDTDQQTYTYTFIKMVR